MIKNKNQFKIALKNNNIKSIKRIYNFDNNNKINESASGVVTYLQSNAYKVKWDCLDHETWTYFDDICIENNNIIYYQYVPDYKNIDEIKEKLSTHKYNELYQVADDDKINKDFKKGLRNWKYIYKYIVMVNKIEEVKESEL